MLGLGRCLQQVQDYLGNQTHVCHGLYKHA